VTLKHPSLDRETTSLEGQVRALESEVRSLSTENANLRLKIRMLEMAQARPVRADDENQSYLDIKYTDSDEEGQDVEQESESASAPAETEAETTTTQVPSSTTKRGRKPRVSAKEKFEELEITESVVFIPEEVKADPDAWIEIPGEIIYEVIVHPVRLSRRKIERKKFVPREKDSGAPIIAKAPIRFSTSFISVSLAIYIVLSKYFDHSTLYRLERKFARLGADISRQSQSDTVERFSTWMRPLYELIERRANASNYLLIDETFIKYINGNKSGSGQGYFWAFYAPGQSMVLKWIDNRRHENVAPLLDGFSGILHSDGYAAYANYAAAHPEVTLMACWAHTFRKFRDALEEEPKHARTIMSLISKLYDLEESWDKAAVTDSKRQMRRAQESKPIAEQIKTLLDAHAVDMTIPRGRFREAVAYAANHWSALYECFNHGHTKLDTNLLESSFRPTKIGAKNWMFIGHPDAGEKSAIIYTLLNCCRIHQVEPQAYFQDVLDKIIPYDGRPPEQLLEALMPENWILANPEHLFKEPRRA